jgi:thiol:disulfide interchange protein DsbD
MKFRTDIAAGLGNVALLCAASVTLFGSPVVAEDILKPEEAFRYEVSSGDDEITVTWTIEPGHYLYRKRMAYASSTAGLDIGAPVYPTGLPHSDEFFGDMEIYRNRAVVRIPVTRRAPGLKNAVLEVRSQGCADIGLCYPPQKWAADIAFATGPGDAGPGESSRLRSLLNQGSGTISPGDPLPPELAFRPTTELIDSFNVQVSWAIADGYYLYRDSLAVTAAGGPAQTGPPVIPPGTAHFDEHFGEVRVFYDTVTIDVPLMRATPAAGILPITLQYQGCKEDSICYPMQSTELSIALPVATAGDAPRFGEQSEPLVSEQDRLSNLILNGNLFLVLATFTGLGLLLAFTPCVLPMVPILSGIIAGQGKDVTTGRAFALSLTYVLGMALTYTAAGAAFGAMGGQVQAMLQKPWIIIVVVMLFIALALSMFGLYEFQMPVSVQTRLAALSNRQRAGTFIGTAFMGIVSALVVTTCVAPPLVASMAVIAKAGDITRGAMSLFAMSIGMGIPLLVVGTSAGRWLPKTGAWMNAVKNAFGFMMLGLAVWMLERILPGVVTMALWAILVFMAGIYLGAFRSLGESSTPVQKFGKGAGLLAMLYGAALLLGALGGAENPLQPLRFATTGKAETGMEFKRIKSVADLDGELARAASAGRTVMLDFYADWCVSCKEMEHYTFTDNRVKQSLANAVLLQADVTANDDEDQALLQRFAIFGPPTIVFFDANGRERQNYRVVGYMPADKFSAHIDNALNNHKTATSRATGESTTAGARKTPR